MFGRFVARRHFEGTLERGGRSCTPLTRLVGFSRSLRCFRDSGFDSRAEEVVRLIFGLVGLSRLGLVFRRLGVSF